MRDRGDDRFVGSVAINHDVRKSVQKPSANIVSIGGVIPQTAEEQWFAMNSFKRVGNILQELVA